VNEITIIDIFSVNVLETFCHIPPTLSAWCQKGHLDCQQICSKFRPDPYNPEQLE